MVSKTPIDNLSHQWHHQRTNDTTREVSEVTDRISFAKALGETTLATNYRCSYIPTTDNISTYVKEEIVVFVLKETEYLSIAGVLFL